MRQIALVGICLIALCSVGTAQETLDEALALYSPGGDIHVAFSEDGGAQIVRIIGRLRQALGVPDYLDEQSESEVGALPVAAGDKDLVNKLAQAYYSYADAFLRGLPNQRATFLKGKQWGLKSLRMNPAFVAFEEQDGFVAAVRQETDVAALFWTNANWLRWAEPNILDAIRGGIAQKSLAMSERAIELDEAYSTYGSLRALGAFWQGLPSDPISPVLFTGGLRQDYEKVLASFCKIVDEPTFCESDAALIDPICNDYLENRIVFVQYYLMPLGHWEDARRILQSILDEPIGDVFPLYNGLNQLVAAELLGEVAKHL